MATNPLESLQRQIREAATLPGPEPYVPSPDPIGRLRATLRGDAANDDVDRRPLAVGGADLESALGREVLAMVGSAPLDAAAREEAVRRLGVALQNPTTDNVRSVLRVLVTGRVDA